MNVDNLELNKEYTYKQLCKLLQQDCKSRGNSRNAQFKNWQRYFNFYKPNPKGQKYIITKIYTTPKQKNDNRGKNSNSHKHDEYGKYIQPVLINYLQKQRINQGSTLYTTNNILALELGIITPNYKIAMENTKQLVNTIRNCKVSNTSINQVLYKINNIKRRPIFCVLDRLEKEGYIIYKEGYVIGYKNDVRLADREENKIIKQIEQKVLEELDITKKDLFNKKNRKKYYKLIDEYACEQIEECSKIWQGIKIFICNKIMNIKVLENDKINNLQYELKQKIKDNAYKSLEKQQNKFKKEWKSSKFGIPKRGSWEHAIYNSKFLYDCKVVLDYIVG